MNSYKIPRKLEYYDGKFPKRALKQVIDNPDDFIPELLKVLEYTIANLAKLVRNYDYMAHLYALYLLAQFREKRAYPLVVELFSTTIEGIDDFTGDFITEDLCRVLASVYDGNIQPIKSLIENEQIDEFIRSAALDSMVVLYTQGTLTRDEIYDYLKKLFEKLPRTQHYMWAGVVSTCVDLYPDVLYDEIKQAFEDDLIEPMIMGFDWVEEVMQKGKDTVLQELHDRHHFSLINDTIAEMEWWAAFQPAKPIKPKRVMKKGKGQVVREGRKIGRNEPCPCGSGLKYKKCCGKRG